MTMTTNAFRAGETGARQLRCLLSADCVVRVAGAHDAISARIAEIHGSEAVWASGLGISTVNALPDIGLLTMTELLDCARRMRQATSLPIIADCDSGAEDPNVMRRLIRQYEDAGVAAVCIEDKQYPKRNSFRGGNVLVPAEVFAARIALSKRAQLSRDFVLIARIESLIAGLGVADAVARARLYVDAGADALLVHSKARTIDELAEFTDALAGEHIDVPLAAVPTTYPQYSVQELHAVGFQIVIYANQMLRASIRAMGDAMGGIAQAGSSEGIEGGIATLPELFNLLDYDGIEAS